MDRLAADLRGVHKPRGSTAHRDSGARQSAFVAEPGADEGMLQCLTTNGMDLPETVSTGLQAVSWRYDQSAGTLYRREESLVSGGPNEPRPAWIEVARGVKGFELKYWDGLTWRERWQQESFDHPPPAARMNLKLQLPEGGLARHRMTVHMYAGKIPNQNR